MKAVRYLSFFVLFTALAHQVCNAGKANHFNIDSTPNSISDTSSNCDDQICALCLESGFPNGGKCYIDQETKCENQHRNCVTSTTTCNHEFCKNCIGQLKSSSVTNRIPLKCPMCRQIKGCQQQLVQNERLDEQQHLLIRHIFQLREYEKYHVRQVIEEISPRSRTVIISYLETLHRRELLLIRSVQLNADIGGIIDWLRNYLLTRPNYGRQAIMTAMSL